MGAVVVGPQENRFTSQWDGAGEKGKINAARSMWTALGTFLLWFGWYGFNIGSLLQATDGRRIFFFASDFQVEA